MAVDVNKWQALDFDDKYSAGMAWQRTSYLMREDPFVGVLGETARDGILAMLYSATKGMLSDESGRIAVTTRGEVMMLVREAFAKSAIAKMLTDEFMTHVANMCVVAVFAGRQKAAWDHLRDAHDHIVYIGDTEQEHRTSHPDCDWRPGMKEAKT